MAYFAPFIDASGLHIPSYTDVRDDLIARHRQIYGQDIYLGNDAQDYQQLCAFAEKTYDTMLLLQQVYQSFSPSTAMGARLDQIVAINGIRRKPATALLSR